MMYKIIIFLLILVLVSSSILSEEETVYDYNDLYSYQNQDFYANSDPNEWDWSKVNWYLVDFNRVDIYEYPEFYSNLPAEKYSELNYRLITDYSLIADHSLIDGTKFAQDFGCEGCDLEFDEFSPLDYADNPIQGWDDIRYSEDGRITHLNSEDYVYTGDFPAGVLFSINNEGINIFCSDIPTFLCVPESENGEIRGSFRINTFSEIDLGLRTLNYNDNRVSGILSFDGSRTYLKPGNAVTINGVAIDNSGST